MNKILEETKEAYNKLVSNPHFISRIDKFMKIEIREYAVRISTDKMKIWNSVCTPEYIKRVEPIAAKEGFDNVLSYQLAKDTEYCQAEAIIKLIDNYFEPLRKGEKQLLRIPTKAKPEEILNFWLKLRRNNEKGRPYWNNKTEIEHFVYQNFEGFPGVEKLRTFNPDMNKSELYQVAWMFFNKYGRSKTKSQYETLLIKNFDKFRKAKNIYSNIKDHMKDHLKKTLS